MQNAAFSRFFSWTLKLQSSDSDCTFAHSTSEHTHSLTHTHTSLTLHLGTSHKAASHFFKIIVTLQLLLFVHQTMGKFVFTYPSILINFVSDRPTEAVPGSCTSQHLCTGVFFSFQSRCHL